MQKTETVTYTHFVDDVDGTESTEDKPGGTLKWTNSKGYLVEVDLVGSRYDEAFNLLDGLEPYARRSNPDELRRSKPRKASAPSGKRAENAALRGWARDNGHAVGDRGAIPKHLWEAWEQAGRPGM